MANRTHNPRPLRVPAAAEYLGISENHIRRLVYERRIAYVKIGSRVVFLPDDLERFLHERRIDPQ